MSVAESAEISRAVARACATCGYDLAGMELGPCPGCGTNPPAAAKAAPIGQRAAHGVMMMAAQSLVTRVATFAGQVIVARILLPNDFGLFAIANSVASIATMLQVNGVREILVARQKRFGLWQNAGIWVSSTMAIASGAAIALSGPIMAWFYHDPRLIGLLIVLGASQPMYNTTVHECRQQLDLKFKPSAMMNLAQGLLIPGLMVAFALMGAGAYSFVLPRVIAWIVRSIAFQALVPIWPRRDPQFRLWKFILRAGALMLGIALLNGVTPAAPALILYKLGNKDVVGYFAFAFNISMQGVVMLGMMLDSVMFPALGRLKGEPERQRQAFMRTVKAVCAGTVPMAAGQALVAVPLFHILFGTKWDASVPMLQILSVGMIYLAVFIPATSLILAHGLFTTRLKIVAIWASTFVVTGTIAAYFWGGEGVAGAMALSYLGSGLHLAAEALRPLGGSWKDAVRAIAPSHLIGLAAAAAGIGAGLLVPKTSVFWNAVEVCAIGGVFVAVYTLLLRVGARDVWDDLMSVILPMMRRFGLPVGGREKTA